MKIRSGFVSNSSSSSFLIYGISLDSDVILKALNVSIDEESDEYEDDIYELLEGKLPSGGKFEYHNPYDCGEWAIGKSWSNVGDDETGRQFKDSVESELKAIFGEDLKFSTMKEAWRDY